MGASQRPDSPWFCTQTGFGLQSGGAGPKASVVLPPAPRPTLCLRASRLCVDGGQGSPVEAHLTDFSTFQDEWKHLQGD